jgi:hypothetical protein
MRNRTKAMTPPRLTREQAMKEAYDDYPSQDNEGYQPERGSFKAGFYSAWRILEAERDSLQKRVSELEAALKTVHELLDTNGIGLSGEDLQHRVSDVVAQLAQAQARIWMLETVLKAVRVDAIAIANEKREYVISGWAMDKIDAALEAEKGQKP